MRWGKDPEPRPAPPKPHVEVIVKDRHSGAYQTIQATDVGLSRGGTALIIHGIREEEPKYDTGVDVCIPLDMISEWQEKVIHPVLRRFHV
jgi:hypothetical protein